MNDSVDHYSKFNERLKKYIENTREIYTKEEIEHLKRINIETIISKKRDLPDLYRQVLEEIGYYDLNESESGYNAFIEIIDKEFGIDKNIIEVGGGVVPTLAHKISLKQKAGNITIYDPRLSTYHKNTSNFILKKEKFINETDVSSADLIIGFMPCEATQTIIENATMNRKDFIIAMCEGGAHGDIYDYFESTEEWLNCMLYLAEREIKSNDMGELKVLSFKKYLSSYPIIYNKKQ